MTRPAVHAPTRAYLREARRLRGAFSAGSPELYRSLQHLADRHNAASPAWSEGPSPVSGHRTHAAQRAAAFARYAAAQLDRRVLPYSRRLQLLKTADQLGIGRFHANLIIAAVQHEATGPALFSESPSTSRFTRSLPMLTFLFVQGMILAGLWAALLH